ncbi:ATP-binding protein [Roseovarius spongiae]|uniref:ATP-binding protein n=1 Tax=Roseovarius spongiae TaxID=2320272 RepID=UPI001408685A|nr:ATP-binding protein [Roseovarius spongiae]
MRRLHGGRAVIGADHLETLTADGGAIRACLARIRGFLLRSDLAPETCGTIEIVLAEVLNNLAEHAYPANAPGPVHVTLSREASLMHVTIRDHGAPLPGLCLPKGAAPVLDVARTELPEGGFGWFLIRTLAHDLEYRREGEENRLSFVILCA